MGRYDDLLLNAKSRRWDDLVIDDRPPTRRELKLRSLRGRSEMGRIDRHLELMERSGLVGIKRRSGLSRKAVDLAESLESTGEDTFSVYAAVFGNVDHQGDVIQPHAVRNLGQFVEHGVVLLGHRLDALPIASIETAVQDDYGLLCRGRWHSTPDARAVRTVVEERLARGKTVGASIGYEVLESHQEFAPEVSRTVRVITAMNVFEFSFVNIPANPQAVMVP